MQGRGGGEPKCAPDIGKPILLADAVVIIDYYLDNAVSAQEGRSGPNQARLDGGRTGANMKTFSDGTSGEEGGP